MKITCPNCRRPIESGNINVEKDYAVCSVCQNVFSISGIFGTDTKQRNELSEEIINNPPKGTWKYENYDGITIGASTRSAIAFFLVPFMAVWSGGSLGGIYITQIISGEFNLMLSLFGLPFLIGSIVLLFITLKAIAGKVEVVIGMDSYVFTGIGKIGIKKRFDWDSVTKIYEEENVRNGFSRNHISRNNRIITSSIFIEGETRIRIGTGLKDEHKYFLLTALKYYHNKSRR